MFVYAPWRAELPNCITSIREWCGHVQECNGLPFPEALGRLTSLVLRYILRIVLTGQVGCID